MWCTISKTAQWQCCFLELRVLVLPVLACLVISLHRVPPYWLAGLWGTYGVGSVLFQIQPSSKPLLTLVCLSLDQEPRLLVSPFSPLQFCSGVVVAKTTLTHPYPHSLPKFQIPRSSCWVLFLFLSRRPEAHANWPLGPDLNKKKPAFVRPHKAPFIATLLQVYDLCEVLS